MSKYIKLEDAIEIIRNEIDKVKIRDSHDMIFRSGLRLAKNMLLDMPTIDIVHCKDCKNSRVDALDSNEEPQRWCKVGLAKAVGDDDYCSWGE